MMTGHGLGHEQADGAAETGCARPGRATGRARLLDWVESQSRVTRIWLDELIAEGDPNDMASMIHRQAAWLELMQDRLRNH